MLEEVPGVTESGGFAIFRKTAERIRKAKEAGIIALFMDPPQHAAVFCADEKTAIQALDRLDPVLPLSPRRAERHGFEYYRHGTLSLYAALDVQTGKVQGKTAKRHASDEFVAFLQHALELKCVGLLFDRHKTPLTRGFAVYCCSAVYMLSCLMNAFFRTYQCRAA